MTIQQMKELLNSTGIPFAYYLWKSPPAHPYGVFFTPTSNNLSADGVVYYSIYRFQIELYTETKDPESEEAVEGALFGAGIFYEKTETYIDAEEMFQITYECEV